MDYERIPPAPETVTSANILVRLIDGLAFRYYWATKGLQPTDLNFKPCETSMDMIELLNHIHHLMVVTYKTLSNDEIERTPIIDSFEELNKNTLEYCSQFSAQLKMMSDEELMNSKFRPKNKDIEYPFWNLINGPIADALTHVGQVITWRRINDNQVQKHNPFLGTPN